MMKSSYIFFAIFFVISTGCSSVGTNDEIDLNESFFDNASKVQFSTVSDSLVTIEQSQSGNYKFEEKTNIIINDPETFENFWKDLHSNRSPLPELPEVDFSENTVIASMMGVQSSGGFTIEISEISEADDIIGVKIEETEPGPNCVTTAVLTSPFHIVKIPKAGDADIRFVTNRTAVDCEEG